MTVGDRIRQLRKEKGLTQEELGELLGVKKAAVQKYESGQVQNLKQSTIQKLCEIFNRNPSYFIFNDLELEKELKEDVALIEQIQKKFGENIVYLLEVVTELNNKNLIKVLEYANDVSILQMVEDKNSSS